MPTQQLHTTGSTTKLLPATVSCGLLIGTLDILAAIIQTLLRGGDPLAMLKFIASGIFGNSAFSAPIWMSGLGLLFHYCIAMIWTLIFVLGYENLAVLRKNKFVVGIIYGIFVWAMMNLVVLPLSKTPPITFKWPNAITAMIVLILAIGLPLAFVFPKLAKKSKGRVS